jgi:hypothetical protein
MDSKEWEEEVTTPEGAFELADDTLLSYTFVYDMCIYPCIHRYKYKYNMCI